MSSDLEHDTFGDTEHEDPFFLHVPENTLDSWSLFYSGILIGFAGGALPSAAPWLAGILIAAGYGLTAFTLKGPSRRFAGALRFGFVLSALSGAALFAGEIFAPKVTQIIVDAMGKHHLIFASIATTPWVLGVLRYVYALLMQRKRPA
ncbi:MAG: hypothetical protein ACLPPF_14500 [Rhodomicrobium sp.]